MSVWVILADGEVDQMVESTNDKQREMRDLRKLGFDVSVKRFANVADAETYMDSKRGY